MTQETLNVLTSMSIFDFFAPKYTWDFYRPVGFSDKEWVCSRELTGKQAIELSIKNGWLYEIKQPTL